MTESNTLSPSTFMMELDDNLSIIQPRVESSITYRYIQVLFRPCTICFHPRQYAPDFVECPICDHSICILCAENIILDFQWIQRPTTDKVARMRTIVRRRFKNLTFKCPYCRTLSRI